MQNNKDLAVLEAISWEAGPPKAFLTPARALHATPDAAKT